MDRISGFRCHEVKTGFNEKVVRVLKFIGKHYERVKELD